MIHHLLPDDGPRDLRTIHRVAAARVSAAVRGGRVRDAVRWGRAVKRALRALRFAARIRAGTVRNWVLDDSVRTDCPHASHSTFSEPAEKVLEPAEPTSVRDSDGRRTFREGRRRR